MHQAFKEKAHRMNQNFKTAIGLYLFSLVVYVWVGCQGFTVPHGSTLPESYKHTNDHKGGIDLSLSPAPSFKPFPVTKVPKKRGIWAIGQAQTKGSDFLPYSLFSTLDAGHHFVQVLGSDKCLSNPRSSHRLAPLLVVTGHL